MVATRIVLVFDYLIMLFALGADWLIFGNFSAAVGSPNYYTMFDLDGMLGGYIGNQAGMTCVQSNLSPLVLGDPVTDMALVAVPVGVVVGFASFSRWQLSLPSGVMLFVGGALWEGGIYAISPAAANGLAGCSGFNGPPSLDPSLGPYFAMAAGALLVATYYLTRIGKLDPPLEGRPPAKPAQG